mgnify:CR=1 FL=1
MAEEKANMNKYVCNKNTIIIAVTAVLLAVIFIFFYDRQQKRQDQLGVLTHKWTLWKNWDRHNEIQRTKAVEKFYNRS